LTGERLFVISQMRAVSWLRSRLANFVRNFSYCSMTLRGDSSPVAQHIEFVEPPSQARNASEFRRNCICPMVPPAHLLKLAQPSLCNYPSKIAGTLAFDRSMTMKAFGKAVTLIGAVALMFAIVVAQRNYQRSWSTGAYTQPAPLNETIRSAPERLAQVNR
jgi:hypothetical protein